jgi:phosphoglucomutase
VRGGERTPVELPATEALALLTDDGSTVVIRPSGTEPKIKVYYMVKGSCGDEAKAKSKELSQAVGALTGL